jgi:phosphoribosylformylglycinamidine synthase subunit PurS
MYPLALPLRQYPAIVAGGHSSAKPLTAIVTDITGCPRHQPARRRGGRGKLRGRGGGVTLPPVARVVVEVMLKPEIHDPQGEAIASACHRLGFGQVVGVRQGKRFEVELSEPVDETAMARVAELAGELLANPVIEEFTVSSG